MTVPRQKWSRDAIGFVVVFPNVQAAGASSLGVMVIEHVAGSVPGIVVDRMYLPRPGRGGAVVPPLNSETFNAPPRAFQVMGFSCSFELDYRNLVAMLGMARIPRDPVSRNAARQRGESIPLVIAGGVSVSANPLPLLPYMDFIFMHDAETSFHAFLSVLARVPVDGDLAGWWASYGGDRRGIVPAFLHGAGRTLDSIFTSMATARQRVDLDACPVPLHQPVIDPLDEGSDPGPGLGSAYLLEAGRGCGRGCRFCLLSHHLRPPSFRSGDAIESIVDAVAASNEGHGKVAFIGSNVSEHPGIEGACRHVLDRGLAFSMPSIARATPGMLSTLRDAGIRTVAIAPETGSDRLREIINKNIPSEHYVNLVSALVASGVSTVKVYLMHGLPAETEGDRDETLAFLERLVAITRPAGARLAVSLNPFVPKLGTPFMVHSSIYTSGNFKAFKQSFKALTRAIERLTRAKVGITSPADARVQAFLSLGGVDALRALVDDDPGLGAMMDATFEAASRLFEAPLPSHLETIMTCSPAFLKREWNRAMRGETTVACGGGSCAGCGAAACDARQ